MLKRIYLLTIAAAMSFCACEGPMGPAGTNGIDGENGVDGTDGIDGSDGADAPMAIQFENFSKTPALIMAKEGFTDVEVYSLLSSEDKFINSPAFTFGGSADGLGLAPMTDGYALLINNEDNYAVSRIILDDTFKPIQGEYILNSDGSGTRRCSATMATLQEHGFGPLFLTAGESGVESQVQGIDPFANAADANIAKHLPALGRWNAENAVPLPASAYDETIILIGDDDSRQHGGQLAMYRSESVGDLSTGSVYVLKRTDENMNERQMVVGQSYPVVFAEIENAETNTGAQNNQASTDLKAIPFGRVEDIDYNKGNGKEIYFNVTGQGNGGDNSDNSRSVYGRVYKLMLSEDNPLEGTLEVILDGDDRDSNAGTFQNPDNICVGTNFLYVQEDPNKYGNETHDAYIYQYNLTTKELKIAFELDHGRNDADKTDANWFNGPSSAFGAWEYGGMISISDQIGIDDVFLLAIQPHTWKEERFKGVDGGSGRPNEMQGSQILILKGLPQ
ncbi:hypothetical protein [Persicobacter psychrovividus]|uniref:Phosphatase n=1 Tax=Persicobacter psychrovividus TaxID=387638 RepID=A0ABM7VJL6_9BACT|nr:hypothetical protein PEPS_32900 [Persicobacter psychrovividus]